MHDTNLIYSPVLGLQRDEKGGKPGHSSVDCAHLNITMRVKVLFSKFVDGAPRLAVGVREVDGIDSFSVAPASYRRAVKVGTRRLCQS